MLLVSLNMQLITPNSVRYQLAFSCKFYKENLMWKCLQEKNSTDNVSKEAYCLCTPCKSSSSAFHFIIMCNVSSKNCKTQRNSAQKNCTINKSHSWLHGETEQSASETKNMHPIMNRLNKSFCSGSIRASVQALKNVVTITTITYNRN